MASAPVAGAPAAAATTTSTSSRPPSPEGDYFSPDNSAEAILNVGYARRKGIEVGDELELKGHEFEVVGLASPPLGGQASDVYLKLDRLQRLSDRVSRANTLYVRAESSDDVAGLTKGISGFDPSDPDLRAAFSACRDSLPQGVGPPGGGAPF